jgi:hypothetical protein
LEAAIKPFAHVTIGDANAGAIDTLTITLGGVGGRSPRAWASAA